MNKYQDALNSLNPNYIGEQEYSWRKATELLQELVDKETPIKVRVETADNLKDLNNPYIAYFCPNCKRYVHNDYKWCPKCGQKLDWEE